MSDCCLSTVPSPACLLTDSNEFQSIFSGDQNSVGAAELGQTEPVLAADTEAGDGLAVQLGVAQTRRGRVTDTRLSQC